MEQVPEKFSFPQEEERILAYWDQIDAFQESLRRSEGRPEYSFYDGPPFATGLPHYGHILAGTIKDIVTRYAHNTGHHVNRRFGWDCHGLPIEFEIDKKLGIKTKEQILEFGIANYNEECRSIVMRFAGEWERIVKRTGRWIDFQNDYKTMDIKFMESVWWVFKTMFDKDLVYRGYKVVPYSTGCTTPLSNFEANLNYQDVVDPAIIVSFPLVSEPEVSFVAWTTTPWTLPSNLALCVNPDLEYVKIRDKEKNSVYIMMEARLIELYKDPNEYEVLEKFLGKTLEGKRYVPLFNYFVDSFGQTSFRVLCDSFVTSDAGTGIVHCAPAFGEDDYRVCVANGVCTASDIPCPVDDNGNFTSKVTEFAGIYVKEADKAISKLLKGQGRVVHQGTLKHSYPFCWRSDTPLLYRAIPSWFVRVERVKERLLENNELTYWVPSFVKEKRFRNWLESSRDWAISRNRYWGTPLPIWVSDDYEEVVVVGSIEELKKLTGATDITDLHRHHIDHLTIPSKQGKGVLRRISEVFDCWFESGSMPYAQQHYPFERKEQFEASFPADFIAEGIDQTRGWFYTLLVISTCLFDKPPFKNLIVNGLVLAGDGKKMSKRLKNYPEVGEILDKYGADTLRLYLINSPVVRADSLKFKEEGVKDVIRDVFLRWYNAYRLFVQTVLKIEKGGNKFVPDMNVGTVTTNIMDKWILASIQDLIKFVRQEMTSYRLYTVVPRLVNFILDLANWYVRLNRNRMKGKEGPTEEQNATSTLFVVLITLCRIMAPFTPFFTENLYLNLKNILPENEREQSLHFVPFPNYDENLLNDNIVRAVSRMQKIIELGRTARDRKKIPVKYPLKTMILYLNDEEFLNDVRGLEHYIISEMNVKNVVYKIGLKTDDIKLIPQANKKMLGQKLRGEFKNVENALFQLSQQELLDFEEKGSITVLGYEIFGEELLIVREYAGETSRYEACNANDVIVVLDSLLEEDMELEGISREITNRVQKLRKSSGLLATDEGVRVYYSFTGKQKAAVGKLEKALEKFLPNIQEETRTLLLRMEEFSGEPQGVSKTKIDVVDVELKLLK